jgi:hypothetical protein
LGSASRSFYCCPFGSPWAAQPMHLPSEKRLIPKRKKLGKKVENESFSFLIPPGFKKTKQEGIDSFVEEYVSDGMLLNFDLGRYSNSFTDWPPETKYQTLNVHGKSAKIGTVAHAYYPAFPHSTQIHIKLSKNFSLSMFAACKSEKEVAIAGKIFETITFKAKKN